MQTLRNAIAQDRLAHAYLFVGPRGTGKTSTARIFAKALNCTGGPKVDFDPNEEACREIAEGISLDVLEIDGASNNGVEQVRELRETVKFAPARGRFKIYYIDEVHMLTTAAFNALLKTLEEPPSHVKFIFATTEPNKILPTILSRCQRFDLRRIPTQVIADHLLYIAKEEGVDLDQAAAYSVAKGADGGMRDAQSMLDQLVAFCGNKINEENVLEIFGFSSQETISDIIENLLKRKTVEALDLVHAQSEKGKDLGRLLDDMISYLRNVLVASVDPKHNFDELAPEIASRIQNQVKQTTPDRLLGLIDHFAETETKMKWAPNKRLHMEIALIKAVQILTETTISDVIGILNQASPIAAKLPAAAPAGDVASAKKKSEPALSPAPEPEPAVESAPTAAASAGDDYSEVPWDDPDPLPAAASPSVESAAEEPELEEEEEVWDDSQPRKEDDLWKRVVAAVWKEGPLVASFAAGSVFLKQTDKQFVVGVSPKNSFARDQMMRPNSKKLLESLLNRFGNVALELVVEVKQGIPDPVVPEMDTEDDFVQPAEPAGNEARAEAAPPKEVVPEKKDFKPEPIPEPEPEPAPSGPRLSEAVPEVDPQEFLDDPLIKEALRMFEAKVE